MDIAREYVEVLILDSRAVSRSSQWGHVAIEIDEAALQRADKTYFTGSYRDYLRRLARRGLTYPDRVPGMHRDGTGFLLQVTPGEKAAMLAEQVTREAEAQNTISSRIHTAAQHLPRCHLYFPLFHRRTHSSIRRYRQREMFTTMMLEKRPIKPPCL
ncbi:hypothetical protein ACTMU2_36730 [Cupriavidus basilensis]